MYQQGSFVNCLPPRLSIVQRTRTIRFKTDHFSRGIISYVSWGIRLHEGGSFLTFRLIHRNLNTLYRKGDHFIWGDKIFRDTGTYFSTKEAPNELNQLQANGKTNRRTNEIIINKRMNKLMSEGRNKRKNS